MGKTANTTEEERLEALDRYKILHTDPESEYDRIVELASVICETPISLVSFVGSDIQWFKARRGIECYQTCRDIAFCSHVIKDNEVMVIPDATQDDRFARNPLVTTDPKIRFYAGAPLTTHDGHNLGALCVIDQTPRSITQAQTRALESLAQQVISLLELRHANNRLASTLERVSCLEKLLPVCAYCKKVRDDEGYWKSVEEYISEHSPTKFSHGICPSCVTINFPEFQREGECSHEGEQHCAHA